MASSSLGTSMDDIHNGRGPWSYETPPIHVSRHHVVLYELPATLKNPPKPHIASTVHHWDKDYVRMPYSPQNLFPINENGEKVLKERWSIIETALLQPIRTSKEFEAIVNSYNTKLPKFLALHNFFEVLEEEESSSFFNDLLPKIINLALRLPQILPGSLPLLKQDHNRSISLSQLQVASLLANAFLCTFPWRKEIAASYPGINFVRLFAAHLRPKREQAVVEKLKAICHYFHRVTDKEPVGVVTFERKYIPKSQLPEWNSIHRNLSETRFHVASKGFIEDDGLGLLQVDFANKNVGGGVLGFGCVQEEIRFVICPELIVSRLFTEQLGPTEALIVMGAEHYSNYGGYGDTFTWEGNHNDTTPHDPWGRRRTTIVAIDALRFNKPHEQYNTTTMLRELNKAYAGFYSSLTQLSAVATGNWGCGAFKGDPKLKALLQLMACSATQRDLVYFTFGNNELQDDLYKMHSFIVSQQMKTSQLWSYLVKFTRTNIKPEHLYAYLQQAHLDTKSQPNLKAFFGSINLKKCDKNYPSTSTASGESTSQNIIESLHNTENMIDSSLDEILIESSPEIIDSSQPKQFFENNRIKQQNDILHLFDVIDGNTTKKKSTEKPRKINSDVEIIEVMETSDSNNITPVKTNSKHKITDYFLKVDKG